MCQVSGTGEYHVARTYDDFEWLQQHLFSQEDVPGIQGVIVSTLFHLCTTYTHFSVKRIITSVCCLLSQ